MAGVTTSRTKGQRHSSSLLRLIVCMLALQQDECLFLMPEPVKNFACVAYDDTDTTVCTWELGKEYNWRVKSNLLWRTSGSQEQWKLCPDLGLTSCTWRGSRLPPLELRVDVTCECGVNASSLHTLDTNTIIPKTGTIIPNDGRVCTGQNINLTFTPFNPQVMENVRLEVDRTLVSSAPTQIVNTTAIFTVSIMSEKEFPANDDYVYNCCFTSWDCMSLRIYIMPEPVKNFTCVAYDDTDTTVCTWEVGKKYNWEVKPNLHWRKSGSQKEWKLCPDLGLTNCTWNVTRLPTLELRVDVSCECGVNASSLHTLDTKAIRTPEPAISVKATSLNSSCILVTWSVKQTSYAKTHHLFVGSKWNDSQLHRYNDTDMETGFPKSREKIICGLNPDTVYECSVALLPQNGGYFSRNVTTSTLTHYTVPGSSPSMVPDGFEWNPASCVGSRYRFVTVYWQPIPKLDQNGEIKAYVLTIEGDRVSRDVQEVASDVTSLRLYLMCDTYYTVHIQARNNAGTSRQRSRIVIPQATAAPAQTNFVVELLPQTTDEISRQVALSLVNKGQGRHTVFYCRKGQLGGCDWKTPVRWVSMETTEATFDITDPLNTMFGVSTSVDNVRSGFSWNDCLYTRGQVPSTAPDGLAVQPGPEDNSLYVTWDKIPCRPGEPHISRYIVQYCLQNSSGACLDQHNVTVAGGFTAVTLLWLQSDVTYNVRVQGVSNMGAPGPFSRPVVGIPLTKRLPDIVIVAIIVGGVILLACLIPGCKCIRGRCKRLCHVEEVPIKDLLLEDVNVTPTNKP